MPALCQAHPRGLGEFLSVPLVLKSNSWTPQEPRATPQLLKTGLSRPCLPYDKAMEPQPHETEELPQQRA